ncbi:T9SS type A sorting domain-containing protein [Aquimarina macrocephali]|uniref:T9SS type A sorting domain-containing protein n=1 Tax=Aquimarina macrocephali TaxID=666563 RepID=UPI0004BC3073|nr:T9SS type A sorting domain-containing protein [Aquimarina macrocephali]
MLNSQYFLLFFLFSLSVVAQQCDNRVWSGVAKYHHVTNATTSCGYSPMANDTLYAALRATDYQAERLCNTCLKVSSNKGSVIVKVMDKSGTHGLDIHKKTFAKLGDTLLGNVNVTWKITTCPEQGNMGYYYSKSSFASEKRVMVVNTKSTVKKLYFRYQNNDFKEVFRAKNNSNDFFVITWRDDQNLGPYDFKVVDIYNNSIIDRDISFSPNTTFYGQNQFIGCDVVSEINNESTDKVAIKFQNPMSSNGSISIETDQEKQFTIYLYSLKGLKILEANLESNSKKHLFKGIQEGLYIISVYSNEGLILNKKLILQN